MDEKQRLNNDMYLLMGALCKAGASKPEDFYKGEAYGLELETEDTNGAIEVMFLSHPTEKQKINDIIAKFEETTKRKAVMESEYMGSDVDVDKTRIAVGINGPIDCNFFKKEIRDSQKRISKKECKIISEIANGLAVDTEMKKGRHV